MDSPFSKNAQPDSNEHDPFIWQVIKRYQNLYSKISQESLTNDELKIEFPEKVWQEINNKITIIDEDRGIYEVHWNTVITMIMLDIIRERND